jgi:hypothetical protein
MWGSPTLHPVFITKICQPKDLALARSSHYEGLMVPLLASPEMKTRLPSVG